MKLPIVAIFALCIVTISGRDDRLRVIGLFPHPGISHFHFFHPLMRGLAKAGHDVTVVSYFPEKVPVANYTDLTLTGMDALRDFFDLQLFMQGPFTYFRDFFMIHGFGLMACEALLKSDALTKILNAPKPFDVVIVEQFNNDCVLGVAHKLNAPVIGLSSCAISPWHYKRVGTPDLPSYIPALLLPFSQEMGLLDRVRNFLYFHSLTFLYRYWTQPKTNRLLKTRFGDSIPDIRDLESNVSILLTNQHYSLSGVKPLTPAVIELGGLHIQEFQPLHPEMKGILDAAKGGVIYISWGSLLRSSTLPDEKREAILNALGRFEHVVLWKWENESIPNQPKNVHIRKWMPQKEILCHPNVKVFMSHGGLLGSSEAAYCGVPMVVTPMLGDQFMNAAGLVQRGMGVLLPFKEITEDAVYNAIKQALHKSTWENAQKVSTSYRDRPQKPLETAIWWVEHVVKMKGLPLIKSPAIELPWYIVYSFDTYAVLVLFLFACYHIAKFLCHYIVRRLLALKNVKRIQKKSKPS